MTIVEDRIKRAAIELITLTTVGTGAVAAWAPAQHYPQRPSSGVPVVTATLQRGPEIRHSRVLSSCEPTDLRWSITPTADTLVGLSLAGVRFTVETGSLAADAVRDALLAILQADTRLIPGVTAAADGGDGISLTGAIGTMYTPCPIGPGAAIAVNAETTAEVETANARALLEFQAYASGPGIAAQGLLSRLTGSLKRSDILASRFRLGVAFEGPAGDMVDLQGLAGPQWESRASVRLPVTLRSYSAAAVDDIATVSTTLQARTPDGGNAGPPEFTVP